MAHITDMRRELGNGALSAGSAGARLARKKVNQRGGSDHAPRTPSFPIAVRTGWVEYSPAFHSYASHRVRSRLAGFATQISAVTVRVSDDELRDAAARRCEVEVVTRHAGPISASSVGVDLFTLVDSVVEMLRKRPRVEPSSELRQRIA